MRPRLLKPLSIVALSQTPLVAAFFAPSPARWGLVGLWLALKGVMLSAVLRPKSRSLCPAVDRGPALPIVALTFDDGPHPEDTPAILERLAARGAAATFFFVGAKARAHPELVARAGREGHQTEIHSDTHPWWFCLAGPDRLRREIRDAAATLERITGRPPSWFRSPMGHKNWFLREELEGAGLRLAGWSVRPFDTVRRSAAGIAAAVLRGAGPGGIVVLHEGVRRRHGEVSPTVDALGPILEGLRSRGLTPVRLRDLAGSPERATSQAPARSRPPAPGEAPAADKA